MFSPARRRGRGAGAATRTRSTATAAATLARDLAARYSGAALGRSRRRARGRGGRPLRDLRGGDRQRFSGSLDGDEAELRTVIMVLPGQSERQVALLAPRDSLGARGAASGSPRPRRCSRSPRPVLTHEKTLVFVSTDGSTAGAAGARASHATTATPTCSTPRWCSAAPQQPAPSPPLVIPWSSGPQSSGAQVVETARALVSEEVGRPPGDESPLRELLRLALPAALGEQGPLIESGIGTRSGSLRRELPPRLGGRRRRRGRRDPGPVRQGGPRRGHGPRRRPRPQRARPRRVHQPRRQPAAGMDALAAGAGAALYVAAVAGARARPLGLEPHARGPRLRLGGAARFVPFVLAVALLYALALTGGLPSPDFPFDPARGPRGGRGDQVSAQPLIAFALLAFLLRPLLASPAALARVALAAALRLAALAGLGIWAVNPYLGLLTAVGLQALVPAAAGVGGGRLAAAGFVALACVPGLIALADLAARFDAGAGVLWDLVFLFSGEQLTDLLVPLGCVLGGAAFAIVAANGKPLPPGSQQLNLQALIARGRELEERRGAGRPRGGAEPPAEEPPAEEHPWRGDEPREEPPPGDGEPPPGGPQEEPARDPRIWSKPEASTARPLGVHHDNALALHHLTDLAQPGAGGGNRLRGCVEPLGRDRHQQLVVLAARTRKRARPPGCRPARRRSPPRGAAAGARSRARLRWPRRDGRRPPRARR